MRVAVLGGGAAGLTAAVALKRAGVDVMLLEAEPAVGGKLRTVERDGFRCEDGPNSLTAQSTTAYRIAREHGIEITPARPPRTRYVVRKGKLRAAAPLCLAGLLWVGGWARLALEPVLVLGPGLGRRARQEESLHAFLTRHLGKEAGGLVSTLLANGVYAGDPRLLSARDAFPRLSSLVGHSSSLIVGGIWKSLAGRGDQGSEQGDTDPNRPKSLWIPAKGMSELARGLSNELGGGVRVGARVEGLRVTGSSARSGGSGGYDIQLSDGRVQADAVICAVPPQEAARLLTPLTQAAEGLRAIRSSPLAVVHLGYRSMDFKKEPRGFGVLDGDGSLRLLGALFPSSLFVGRAPEGHVLFTCLLGGLLHPELLGLDDASLAALCRADLEKLFGVTHPPVFERVARWGEAVPQPELGHRERVARVREALAALPSVELAGAAYDGVAVEQVMEGGERAAERLLARLATGRLSMQPGSLVRNPRASRPRAGWRCRCRSRLRRWRWSGRAAHRRPR